MNDPTVDVGIDATPLAGGHGARGIGRYLSGLLDALADAPGPGGAARIGVLLAAGQRSPTVDATWRTRRSGWRPQDLDPVFAAIADRGAVRKNAPALWHHTDPLIGSSPLPLDRTVMTVYDLIPLRNPAVMARIRVHRRMVYRRYLSMVRRARGVIAISNVTADDVVVLLGVPRSRIHVVPPYVVAPDRGTAESGDARSSSGDAGPVRLLFVGVPEPHKRADLAIATLAELVGRGVDAQLAFVGVHPAAVGGELDRLTATAGVAGRVTFHGRVGDDRLSSLYRDAILLATSSIEGFGLPPIEALLAGGRVVATPIPAYRESLRDAGVIAAAADPAALANAVQVAIGHRPSAEDRSRIAARFGSRVVATSLRNAYDAMLHG
ncbi:MAG: glycosyltransferase [Chloroflexota bacterium]